MTVQSAANLTFVSAPQGWYAAKQSYESHKGDEEYRKRNLPEIFHIQTSDATSRNELHYTARCGTGTLEFCKVDIIPRTGS